MSLVLKIIEHHRKIEVVLQDEHPKGYIKFCIVSPIEYLNIQHVSPIGSLVQHISKNVLVRPCL